MEAKFTQPSRTTREVKDRNLLQTKMKAIDYIELDAIIDGKESENIFDNQTINTIPCAGYEGWYPTMEELQEFLDEHKTLTKKDIVFLRWLRKVDKDGNFFKNMMNESQRKAYEFVCNMKELH